MGFRVWGKGEGSGVRGVGFGVKGEVFGAARSPPNGIWRAVCGWGEGIGVWG